MAARKKTRKAAKKSSRKPAKKAARKSAKKRKSKKKASKKRSPAKRKVKAKSKNVPPSSGEIVRTQPKTISKRLLAPSTTSGGASSSKGLSYSDPVRAAMLNKFSR